MEYNRIIFELHWEKELIRRENDARIWREAEECGIGLGVPRTPHKFPGNEEQWELESQYGKYEPMEPQTRDSDIAKDALLRKIGHIAPDTPVSLRFQNNEGTPSNKQLIRRVTRERANPAHRYMMRTNGEKKEIWNQH